TAARSIATRNGASDGRPGRTRQAGLGVPGSGRRSNVQPPPVAVGREGSAMVPGGYSTPGSRERGVARLGHCRAGCLVQELLLMAPAEILTLEPRADVSRSRDRLRFEVLAGLGRALAAPLDLEGIFAALYRETARVLDASIFI